MIAARSVQHISEVNCVACWPCGNGRQWPARPVCAPPRTTAPAVCMPSLTGHNLPLQAWLADTYMTVQD